MNFWASAGRTTLGAFVPKVVLTGNGTRPMMVTPADPAGVMGALKALGVPAPVLTDTQEEAVTWAIKVAHWHSDCSEFVRWWCTRYLQEKITRWGADS